MLGTLRQRLLALFLLVSIIPSLGLTLFVTFYLSRSIAALRNPETENALALLGCRSPAEVTRAHVSTTLL